MLRPSDSGCRACPLAESRIHIVNGAGPPDAKLVIVGEAPGEQEDKLGVPFVGRSGKLLRATLSENGFPEGSFYLTNVVKCRPPENRDPTDQEIKACSGWFTDEMVSLQPAGILALGKFAQARVQKAKDDGLIPDQTQIFSAYHPAYILRAPRNRKAWAESIRQVGLRLGTIRPGVPENHPTTHAPAYLQALPDSQSRYYSADTETDDLEEGYGKRTVGYSISDGRSGYFHSNVSGIEYRPLSHRAEAGLRTWMHNAKYDAPALGIDLYNLNAWDDTMLVAYVLRRFALVGLKPLSGQHGYPLDSIKNLLGTGRKAIPFSEALRRDYDRARDYATKDSVGTARLAEILEPQLQAEPKLWRYYHEREKPAVPVLADMEQRGVLINPDILVKLSQQLTDTIDAKTRTLQGMLDAPASFNRASTQQFTALLHARGVPLKHKTPTGQWQLDKQVLEYLITRDPDRAPVYSRELEIRTAEKLKNTYCEPLLEARDKWGRIHARFNQCVTNTSRLSSDDPNLQNIPIRGPIKKLMRSAFIARRGYCIVKADASQLEVRVYAEYTREPILLDAYLHLDHDTAGPDSSCLRCDVHQQVANALGIARWRAKNVLFAAIYGADAPKLAATAGVSEEETGPFLARLRERMPTLLTWRNQISDLLYRQGYVETLLDFRSYFPMFGSVIPAEKNAALREAGNLPIQGTGAGIIKEGMVQANTLARRYEAELVLQVHDEVVYEVPVSAARDFARELQDVFRLTAARWMKRVPFRLDVEIGDSWGTCEAFHAAA